MDAEKLAKLLHRTAVKLQPEGSHLVGPWESAPAVNRSLMSQATRAAFEVATLAGCRAIAGQLTSKSTTGKALLHLAEKGDVQNLAELLFITAVQAEIPEGE